MNSVVRTSYKLVHLGQISVRCISHGNIHRSTVAAAATSADDFDTEYEKALPYKSIPGPTPLPIPYMGNFWRFLSFGTFGGLGLDALHAKLHETYGDVVRLRGIGQDEFILLFDPKDVTKMFRNETVWPVRMGLKSLAYYREVVRKDLFQGYTGVVTSQGKEWHDFRSKINQPMMQPRNARNYIKPIDNIALEFVERSKKLRDKNMEAPKDYLNELNKWALESIACIALDTRMGCLSDTLAPDSDTQKMIESVHNIFDLFYQLDILPSAWRFISTPTYRRYIKEMDFVTDFAMKNVDAAMDRLQAGENNEDRVPSVLEMILLREDNPKVAVTMALDMLIAGVDTTSNSVGILMFYLSKNAEQQQKLYDEIKRIMPNRNEPITAEILNELKYLKACIKESQRMSPITAGTQRRAGKDMVLGGYQIPKGSELITSNMTMSKMEKHYPQANKFIPERWLKSEINSPLSSKNTNPFVFLPFGFGPRMCAGRRFAELEMEVLSIRMIQNFKVTYNYGEMEFTSKTINFPSKPLQFKMEDR